MIRLSIFQAHPGPDAWMGTIHKDGQEVFRTPSLSSAEDVALALLAHHRAHYAPQEKP